MHAQKPNFHLYIDDSGTRRPDYVQHPVRDDGMDYFALGGIIINELEIPYLIEVHKNFCLKWNISYPLHSSRIRGRRQAFAWLAANSALEQEFLEDLETMMLSIPIVGNACIVDRKGYVERYNEKYDGQPWLMCKTAFSILVERSAKYVDSLGGTLEIFFEQAGKAEDRDIKSYMREMKGSGMPFDGTSSDIYGPMSSVDLKRIVRGEPREKTKKFPPIQIADLILYPMIKGGYDNSYLPYKNLLEKGKLIDTHLKSEDISALGIKYSCFKTNKGLENPSL